MPKISYLQPSGEVVSVDAHEGDTVMQAAVDNLVEGIVAECGGGCNCATCHVYVDDEWLAKVGAAEDMELELLNTLSSVQPNSRLSCQIEVTSEIDGFLVKVAEGQF